jgi:hypothetical protein
MSYVTAGPQDNLDALSEVRGCEHLCDHVIPC